LPKIINIGGDLTKF